MRRGGSCGLELLLAEFLDVFNIGEHGVAFQIFTAARIMAAGRDRQARTSFSDARSM